MCTLRRCASTNARVWSTPLAPAAAAVVTATPTSNAFARFRSSPTTGSTSPASSACSSLEREHGLNLAGVKRVLALEARVAELEAELAELRTSNALVPLRQDVVVYRKGRTGES